jgi:hypothetical protein
MFKSAHPTHGRAETKTGLNNSLLNRKEEERMLEFKIEREHPFFILRQLFFAAGALLASQILSVAFSVLELQRQEH